MRFPITNSRDPLGTDRGRDGKVIDISNMLGPKPLPEPLDLRIERWITRRLWWLTPAAIALLALCLWIRG